MSDDPQKATVSKQRFEQVMGALLHVGKGEVDEIVAAEAEAKGPRIGKKRGRKPKA